jgi:hypothetical protein
VSEKTLSSEFVKLTKALDPRRVENLLGIGTPDVNLSTGWVELKWVRAWPRNESTPLRLPHYTDEQRAWLLRRWNAGGGAWLVLQVQREWFVFNGPAAQAVGTLNHSELVLAATTYFPAKPSPEAMCACLAR